jgi:hypothetical protein
MILLGDVGEYPVTKRRDKRRGLRLYPRSAIDSERAFRYHEDVGIGAFCRSDQGFGYAIAA